MLERYTNSKKQRKVCLVLSPTAFSTGSHFLCSKNQGIQKRAFKGRNQFPCISLQKTERASVFFGIFPIFDEAFFYILGSVTLPSERVTLRPCLPQTVQITPVDYAPLTTSLFMPNCVPVKKINYMIVPLKPLTAHPLSKDTQLLPSLLLSQKHPVHGSRSQ